MQTLVLTIHILIALALIGSVLLQRSEGGGLGIGGGGGGAGGGFMTARGTANLMTRVTAILAASFFATSLILAIMAGHQREPVSIVDEVISETPVPAAPPSGPAVPTTE
ncbi:MAG TPA: preprotein translocase subunit SecG [Alphaproteobacteria bacterium]|nr:preprotein translocase subunit SecG [Alphaproteobacteria bacterium]